MSKKLGITKKTLHESVHDGTVEHKHVPGRAYEIEDPVAKLIFTIGGGFFNEPKYYDSNRTAGDFFLELAKEGGIRSTITDELGVTEQAREILQTANEVASQGDPEDLLVIASWVRDPEKGLKIRYTPQILLAVAAANPRTRPHVARYARQIIRRADEIRHVFAAYRHLFCRKQDGRPVGAIPKALRRALGVAFASHNVYNLVKYNSDIKPTFGDILLMLREKSLRNYLERVFQKSFPNYPLSKSMFEYFVNGVVLDDAPAMLKSREKFFKMKNLKEATPEFLEQAGLTWENLISHFGSSKAAWEAAIPLMGEMALLRNLRNFEKAGIGKDSWDLVYSKCDAITDTKQLPFRFFMADSMTTSTDAKSVSGKMLDNACGNVPDLEGVTAIFVDNSGSATGCYVSTKSRLKVSDAGNILAAIAAKKCGRRAKVGVFGDSLVWVPFSEVDSCMSIKEKIDNAALRDDRAKYGALAIEESYRRGRGVGASTETGLWCGIHDLTTQEIFVDRIIICSDFCCYTLGNACNCGHDMNRYFGKGGEKATIQSMLARYRQKVNPKVWVHSVNLNGHSQSQTKGRERVQLLSGWSEQIFNLIVGAEGTATQQQQQEPVEVPTIELLREWYRLA